MNQADMDEPAIEARGLVKDFGGHRALDGIDVVLPRGAVLALLGPNGAGKTTTVRILTTLLEADAGWARVAGHDLVSDVAGVRRSIGVSGQYAAVDKNLTGFENLYLVGRLYGLSRRAARDRADELVHRFRLESARDRVSKTYSGGMRRRLDLAGALVARPAVVVLDEPTTGLDPRSRLDTWDMVRELVDDGTSVLLTTQYLEEADQLANEITVIDRGRVVEHGTADELKAKVGGERLDVVVADPAGVEPLAEILAELGAGEPVVEARMRRVHVLVVGGTKVVVEVLDRLEARAVKVVEVSLHRPRLDDVFLMLTEHDVADTPNPAGPHRKRWFRR
ncbi:MULTISPECIES: ATP-binding cassette domain-containing protein [unclassified Micromonospora]|uniref:ATP-binding cassette domain-containing protein n=1 Tax=unclassified Micromonospora TaxID=2617518 RepID=UPI0022B62726|nr:MULTISPECIES: ATP-binding cassette domain-containing protein [unclassified Micromonospora]MCZ7421949.1 ATP-binding cassette domain-containing protein [Verrucosispora sp. WMMA2121]WBB93316.1 ATP-binding cassette domain-containing protein [Verrucosispora sp. WMMC514]